MCPKGCFVQTWVKKSDFMAKPIEPTPVLENKDAKAFWNSLESTKFDSKKETYLEQSRAVFKHFSKKQWFFVNSTDSQNELSDFLKQTNWFEIEKLSLNHIIKSFSCGNLKDDTELDSFLKEDAFKQQNQKINVTHVAIEKNTNKVIGYVTIMTDKLRVSNKEKKELELTEQYSDFPSVKIGRLAVDKNYSGRNVGTAMLQYITGLVLESAETIGCRFLIVDSYPKSVGFYQKIGFVINLIQDQTRIKILKEQINREKEIINKNTRETISLRYDLLNKK